MFGEILIYYVRRYDVASLLPMQEYGETIRATTIIIIIIIIIITIVIITIVVVVVVGRLSL